METGAITSYIDVAQVVLYVFWLFFAGLILYLRREDKREGYPLLSERSDRIVVQGVPEVPDPKTFLLRDGTTYTAPPGNPDFKDVRAVPSAKWLGAPLVPTGNPLVDAVGPAAYAMREDAPDLTAEDEDRIVPLRVAHDFFVEPSDPNPIGMAVYGCDRKQAGVVKEVWVDRSEPAIRYLEVEVTAAAGPRIVLLPYAFAVYRPKYRYVWVESITAAQFADVPGIKNPDQITKREEDRITAYFGGGHLYATPARQESLI